MNDSNQTPEALAAKFGEQVKNRRADLGMTQDDLALASGVGRRFIIELERGKPTCQLGPALMVLATLGLSAFHSRDARTNPHASTGDPE